MKKKVSILLCALITLISSLVLTGCEDEGTVRENKKAMYNHDNSNKAATFEYNKIMDAEH